MNDEDETILIPRQRYDELLRDQLFLSCLEEAGVDNWIFYEDACVNFELNSGEVI